MAEPAANAWKRNAISQHSKQFKDVYKEEKGSSAVWMQKFFGRAENESVSDEDWRCALAIIVADSKKGRFKQGGSASGFVQDGQTMTVLIAALKDKGKSGRTFAVDTLIWGVSKSIRKQYAKDIQKALGHSPKLREEILLFAKCNLTSAQKKEVLAWEGVPVAARALCGDSKAEAELILEFQKSVEYFEKAKLARQLAYVGTQACAAALVDGLRSSVVHESAYESCSIRSNILEALGMIFDEEALFTIDARLLNSNSDVVFDQRRGLGDYIMDVDNWVLKEFGHSAWDSDVVWFRRVKNVPIVEPRANGTE